MRKILLASLVTASIMFGADAKPINDGPYVLQDNAGSSNKGSIKIENKSASDDLKAIRDYLGLPNKIKNTDEKKLTTIVNTFINTPIKATLLTGHVFTAENSFDSSIDSNPLIFNDENSCKYIGSARYSVASERVHVVLEKKSCLVDDQLVESDIKGFATENLMMGLKTKAEYSNKIVAELVSGRNVELFVTEVKSSKNINVNEITGGAK